MIHNRYIYEIDDSFIKNLFTSDINFKSIMKSNLDNDKKNVYISTLC